MTPPRADHPLRRLFAGYTEQTFINMLGVGDPRLIDYLSELLARFVHLDAVYRLRNTQGRRLEEVAEMVIEAEGMPEGGRTRREVHRHIGDFTLFWTGVYPEALNRLSTGASSAYRESSPAMRYARLPWAVKLRTPSGSPRRRAVETASG